MSRQASGSTDVPLLVRLADLRVAVVGAGRVAADKALPLVDAGADVVVIAPQATGRIASANGGGRLTWHRRRYDTGDLTGAVLAVAATDDPVVNQQVAADAASAATLCVRVDQAAPSAHRGTAAFLGAVRRGPLLLAVSTGGRSPALSRRLRRELAERYGPEYGQLAQLLGELRADPAIRSVMAQLSAAERHAKWRAVLDTDILGLLRKGRMEVAREVASACLSSSSD